MAEESAPGAGDVEIELGGETLKLKPTLEACIAISNLKGGLAAAIQRCNALDFEFICEIVARGLDATSGPQRKQIREGVYKQGVISLSAACILFIHTIANGGIKPTDDTGGQEDGPLAGQS